MKSILAQLSEHVSRALAAALGDSARGVDAMVRASGDAKFGDYQCNAAMGLAKTLGKKPREISEAVVALLSNDAAFGAMCEMPEIAGPGFINLRLRGDWLNTTLSTIPAEPADANANPTADRLGIERVTESQRETVVVDYSSPNVAKQMHVGHLRSTIIGDTISRVLEFEGHNVVRQNHIGDWGTQFGIILEELRATGVLTERTTEADLQRLLAEGPEKLEGIYRSGNAKMVDAAFAERARHAVVRLQSGAADESRAWRMVIDASMHGIQTMYALLGVRLTPQSRCGESFFNPLLPGVIDELSKSLGTPVMRDGVRASFTQNQGALCVFLEREDGTPLFKGSEGEPLPLIVRKSDGAYLYASTDLAAAAFRINGAGTHAIRLASAEFAAALKSAGGLGGDRILYVVGQPQKLHFEMFFAVVRALGWTKPIDARREVRMEHVTFGSVLGEDRKMLKTRSGESVKLKELLDEAVKHARVLVDENDVRRQEDGFEKISDKEKEEIARAVGIGSVKYADLCQNRNTDYVFSWDKMLAMQGNTAPYLMYAYARVRSIFRKGAEESAPAGTAIRLEHAAEIALGKRILQLPETLESISDSLLPHVLCEYLFDLAGRFMAFYENCPVVKAPDVATRASRLRLCDLTARTLRLGLDLLGIRAVERM